MAATNVQAFSGDLDIAGAITSNLEVGTANLFVDTVTGRVGIGLTNPVDVTHIFKNGGNDVYGLLIQQNNSGTGSAALRFSTSTVNENATAISKAGIMFQRSATNGRGDLLFCINNVDDTNGVSVADAALTIRGDGNVGIGSTNPGAPLDVAGLVLSHDSYRKYIGVNNVSNTDKVYLGRFSTYAVGYIEIGSEGNSKFSANKFEIIRQFGDSPYVNGINGDVFHDHTFYYKAVDAYSYDLWHTPAGNTNTGNYRYRIRAGNYSFPDPAPSSSNAADVRYGVISKNGSSRVGIGINNPGATLHVSGVIKSTVPSWGVHQLTTYVGFLKFSDVHTSAQNVTVTHNQGSPTRTRVSATVAGRYFVSFMAFTEANIAAGTGVGVAILRNGYTYCRTYHNQPTTNQFGVIQTHAITIDLDVGDYLEISAGYDVHYNMNAYFSGFLIG